MPTHRWMSSGPMRQGHGRRAALIAVAVAVAAFGAAGATGCESKPKPSATSGAGSAAGAGSAGKTATDKASADTAPPAAAKPATSAELVKAWAPEALHIVAANVHVAPADASPPGLELFFVSDAKPAPDADAEVTTVGVTGGAGGQVVEGNDLLRAAGDGKPAPALLAKIALWVAQRDGEVLGRPTTAEQRKAKVAPPAIKGTAFSFWVLTHEVPPSLEHGTIDLTTGAVALAPPAMPLAAKIAHAIATLNGVSVSRHAVAARTLADACTDARARQALLAALGSNPRVKTRVVVADEARRCGPTVVDALINAMEQDKAAVVRQQAALSLGRIGEPRARPALAKAAKSDDANLVWAAKNALGKIK